MQRADLDLNQFAHCNRHGEPMAESNWWSEVDARVQHIFMNIIQLQHYGECNCTVHITFRKVLVMCILNIYFSYWNSLTQVSSRPQMIEFRTTTLFRNGPKLKLNVLVYNILKAGPVDAYLRFHRIPYCAICPK